MLIELYIIFFCVATIFLFLGNQHESFPMAFLGVFMFLLVGLFLLYEGIDIQTGVLMTGNADTKTFTDQYTTYTEANNSFVYALGNIFLYGSVVALILTTFFAFKGSD